jgi:hypothetical protein
MIIETGAYIGWSFERNIVGLWQKRQRRRRCLHVVQKG